MFGCDAQSLKGSATGERQKKATNSTRFAALVGTLACFCLGSSGGVAAMPILVLEGDDEPLVAVPDVRGLPEAEALHPSPAWKSVDRSI